MVEGGKDAPVRDDGLHDENLYSGYRIRVPSFEGPLDLLLYLVRNYEINIYDIPITMITEQFIAYIRLLKQLDLDVASEFIVMAATLVLIKTRMLLPVDPELDDREDPRMELVEQLLEYQKFKDAARLLEESELQNMDLIERKPGQMVFDFPDDRDNWVDLNLFDLVNAFSRIVVKIDKEEPVFTVLDDIEEDYDPEEKIESMLGLLREKGKILFFDIVHETMRRGEIIITFLAVLHMIKRGQIVVKQHKLFGDINIFLKESAPREEGESEAESTDEPGRTEGPGGSDPVHRE